jgi:hypothetical protein
LNGERGLEDCWQEEDLENQSAFHSRAVLDEKQHTTQNVLNAKQNAKQNIDSPASHAILPSGNTTGVQPKTS